MSLTARELQKIRGIGEVLSLRLLEAGHDSFSRIAALGESGLKAIKGINPKAIPGILEQAGRFAAEESDERSKRRAALKESLQGLRQSVQSLASTAGDRFSEKLSGRSGKKLGEALVRFIEALEIVEERAGKKLKRSGRVVKKAEQQLEGLAEAGLKELRKGLKRGRRALQRVDA